MDLAKMQNANGEDTGTVIMALSTEEAAAVRDALALRTGLRDIVGRISTGAPLDAAPLSRLLGDEPGAASPAAASAATARTVVKRAGPVATGGASAARPKANRTAAKRKK
jgi:hypothetical protein